MTAANAFAYQPLAPPPPPEPPGPDPRVRAHEEAEAIRAAAREQGYREGYAAGCEAGRQDAQPALEAFAAAARELRAGEDAAIARVEAGAVELGLLVAEKTVAGALDARPERVLAVLSGTLRTLVDRTRIAVLVNPDDLALVRDALDDLAASLGGIDHIDVQAERRVGRGGVIVRTEDGEIDSTVAIKLERARELLREELSG